MKYLENKYKFLDTFKYDTRITYERILKQVSVYEDMFKKDVMYFEKSEIEEVLYSFNSNNINTINTYARMISSYLNWAVKNKIININILTKYSVEDFSKFLNNEEDYLAEHNLTMYEDLCENFQDSVILRLIFMGIGGKSMSEIRNLKIDDIDWKNKTLVLTNNIEEDKNGFPLKYIQRVLKVDERLLYLLRGAIEQKTYKKKNGFSEERNNIRPFTDLVNSEYVIRASITNTDDTIDKPVDKFIIYRRISIISETFGIDGLTSKSLQRSGMLHYAKEITNDKGVTLSDIKIIANRFNIKSYYNLKGYITDENIKRTYPRVIRDKEGINERDNTQKRNNY